MWGYLQVPLTEADGSIYTIVGYFCFWFKVSGFGYQ